MALKAVALLSMALAPFALGASVGHIEAQDTFARDEGSPAVLVDRHGVPRRLQAATAQPSSRFSTNFFSREEFR